jgi:hypothetical protein
MKNGRLPSALLRNTSIDTDLSPKHQMMLPDCRSDPSYENALPLHVAYAVATTPLSNSCSGGGPMKPHSAKSCRKV